MVGCVPCPLPKSPLGALLIIKEKGGGRRRRTSFVSLTYYLILNFIPN